MQGFKLTKQLPINNKRQHTTDIASIGATTNSSIERNTGTTKKAMGLGSLTIEPPAQKMISKATEKKRKR